MAANNEYGGVFPVAALAAEAAPARRPLSHRRGAGGGPDAGRRATAWGVDLLSLSAHKMHGPKGAGALFVRRGVALEAHTPGGGQEKRLRAGTENTPAIVGFGVAARLAARAAGGGCARDRARCATDSSAGILARRPGTRVVGAGVAAAAQHVGDPLRGRPGRGAADPARPRRRRRLRRKRLLERHARAVARAARARVSRARRREASSASRCRAGTTGGGDRARPRDSARASWKTCAQRRATPAARRGAAGGPP